MDSLTIFLLSSHCRRTVASTSLVFVSSSNIPTNGWSFANVVSTEVNLMLFFNIGQFFDVCEVFIKFFHTEFFKIVKNAFNYSFVHSYVTCCIQTYHTEKQYSSNPYCLSRRESLYYTTALRNCKWHAFIAPF